jgi:hypothetical protein
MQLLPDSKPAYIPFLLVDASNDSHKLSIQSGRFLPKKMTGQGREPFRSLAVPENMKTANAEAH